MTLAGLRIPRSVRIPELNGDLFTIEVIGDRVISVSPSPPGTQKAGTLLPALVDCHVHLDKTYSLDQTGPAYGDLGSAIRLMASFQKDWTPVDLKRRMGRGLDESYRHGTRALRTHLDWNDLRPPSFDVYQELEEEWRDRLTLQWASLTALDRFDDRAFGDGVARTVKESGGVLGCFVYRNANLVPRLRRVFELAREYDLELDFHVDEGLDLDARGLGAIAGLVVEFEWFGKVTCGHACSLSVQSDARETLAQVALAQIHLVSLPTTNLFLQGSWMETPVPRGLTRVREARELGVSVSLATDNVADPFFPYGSYDLLEAWTLGIQVGHLAPVDDWLDTVTIRPARAMGLSWDGILGPGCPADFMVLDATSSYEMVSGRHRRRVCRQGEWI